MGPKPSSSLASLVFQRCRKCPKASSSVCSGSSSVGILGCIARTIWQARGGAYKCLGGGLWYCAELTTLGML
eukprot:5203230-Amphidinium_carterae.1